MSFYLSELKLDELKLGELKLGDLEFGDLEFAFALSNVLHHFHLLSFVALSRLSDLI